MVHSVGRAIGLHVLQCPSAENSVAIDIVPGLVWQQEAVASFVNLHIDPIERDACDNDNKGDRCHGDQAVCGMQINYGRNGTNQKRGYN